MHTEEVEALERMGVHIPSTQVCRSSQWVALMGGTDRLIDLLARDYFTSRVHLIPADESPISGKLAALLARGLAHGSVLRARRLVAQWEEYAADLTAALPTFVDGYSEQWANAVNAAPRPTPTQVVHASLYPMGAHRWSLRLENYGSALLRGMGLPATRPDVWVPDLHTHVSRRDPVAYSGEERFTLPQPCVYGPQGPRMPSFALIPRRTYFGTAEGITEGSQDIAAGLTKLIGVSAARRDAMLARIADRDGTPFAMGGPRTRVGWRGHDLITWETEPRRGSKIRAERAAVKRAARKATGATGKRGPAVTPWAMSPRSVPDAAERFRGIWEPWEATIRTAAIGTALTFGDGVHLTLISGTQVHDEQRGRAFPIREWVRRYAMEVSAE